MVPDVQGVTIQANASLKQILEQHGITGTPTLLQQLVSIFLAYPKTAQGFSEIVLKASQSELIRGSTAEDWNVNECDRMHNALQDKEALPKLMDNYQGYQGLCEILDPAHQVLPKASRYA